MSRSRWLFLLTANAENPGPKVGGTDKVSSIRPPRPFNQVAEESTHWSPALKSSSIRFWLRSSIRCCPNRIDAKYTIPKRQECKRLLSKSQSAIRRNIRSISYWLIGHKTVVFSVSQLNIVKFLAFWLWQSPTESATSDFRCCRREWSETRTQATLLALFVVGDLLTTRS